jgi:hypothetical protein
MHLPCIGERICGAKKTALASNETDNHAKMRREPSTPQAALVAGDHESLIDASHVEERKPK